MHTLLKTEDGVWEVGYYTPGGNWYPVARTNRVAHAAGYVNFLNGGTVRPHKDFYEAIEWAFEK